VIYRNGSKKEECLCKKLKNCYWEEELPSHFIRLLLDGEECVACVAGRMLGENTFAVTGIAFEEKVSLMRMMYELLRELSMKGIPRVELHVPLEFSESMGFRMNGRVRIRGTYLNSRVGMGYDIHPLVAGRPLIVGGEKIKSDYGALGHSDGDALCHAIIDALLGAASMEDIGAHFPETDRFRNIESTKLLRETVRKLETNGFFVESVDTVVILAEPRLGPYRERIVQNLQEVMRCPVSIKFKTGNELKARKCIECYAVSQVSSL